MIRVLCALATSLFCNIKVQWKGFTSPILYSIATWAFSAANALIRGCSVDRTAPAHDPLVLPARCPT